MGNLVSFQLEINVYMLNCIIIFGLCSKETSSSVKYSFLPTVASVDIVNIFIY